MMNGPIKLGFGAKLKPSSTIKATAVPKKSAFAEEDENGPVASTSRGPVVPSTRLSKEQKKRQEEAKLLDSTVYEYDEVYDYLKEGERQAAEARAKENAERKPRYIEGLLKTAAQRKLDHARAEDKLMERERAREGGEFDDKDAFVTPAYLAQQEEIRKAEEEERRKEEAAAKHRNGLPAFYADYLSTNEAAHAAAVKAAAERPKLGPTMPPADNSPAPLSEAQIAAEASKRLGREIVVNEDGQIVDKRELLTGGLNVQRKSDKQGAAATDGSMGFAVPISERILAAKGGATDNALDESNMPLRGGMTPAQRHRLMRERQSADIEKQMLEQAEKKRLADEASAEESARKYAKRNQDDRVEELRRKAAERRAAREAQLAAEVAAPATLPAQATTAQL